MVALARTATPGYSAWHDGLVRDGVVTIDRTTNWRINPLGLASDILWLLAIAGAIDSWRHRKQWPSRHRDHTRCAACGYSREGLNADTCPECGEAFQTK
ncbi:MAG: hypothetical protein AAGF47_03625 [Planctomycetota bacterium]